MEKVSNYRQDVDEIFKFAKQVEGDTYTLDLKTAREILTEKRLELIDYLKENKKGYVRQIARDLDRNESNIHSDLELLEENGILKSKREGGRRVYSIPHDAVLVEPIVLPEN